MPSTGALRIARIAPVGLSCDGRTLLPTIHAGGAILGAECERGVLDTSGTPDVRCNSMAGPFGTQDGFDSKSVVDELGIRAPDSGSALGGDWSDVFVSLPSTSSSWNLGLRSQGRNAGQDAPAKRNIYLTTRKFDGRHERVKRCARHNM